MITLKLAWRNVMRQKIRTALTVAAITFCTVSILLTMAMAHGMHQQMIQKSLRVFTGHFQIQEEGFLDNPSLNKAFEVPEDVFEVLQNDSRVVGVAPRISSGGLANTDESTSGVAIVGAAPEKEKGVTTLFTNVRRGESLVEGDTNKVVLGETLAENMGTELGEEVQLMVQSYYGSLELGFYEVKGAIATGTPEFDRSLVVMTLPDMQNLFRMEGMITEATVVLDEGVEKGPVIAMVRDKLQGKDDLVVVPWEDLMPELVELLFLDNAGAVLYLAILVVVVAFIILLTITMSVMERVKEFGVLLAIGISPKRIFFMIFLECLIIGALGIVLGLIIGTIPAYYWSVNPIDMAAYAEAYEEFGMGMEPSITTLLNVTMYWSTALIMAVITALSALAPAFRAVRISPVEAMRHV